MAAPLKPWERSGVGQNQRNIGNEPSAAAHVPVTPRSTTLATATAPPPVPNRPTPTTTGVGINRYGPYSSYNSMYSPGMGGGLYGGLGGGMYGGGYSSYSPYSSGMYGSSLYGGSGMYGSGMYGSNAVGTGSPSQFVQQAENSSRAAFQSIESIVQAFASVSMMLESTFHAVYSSFRAVLGVADHFSRLKQHFIHVLSAFALVRTLRYLFRRLLVLLRLRAANLPEDAWSDASNQVQALAKESTPKNGPKSWPIVMFFGVVIGAPWLIWKLLSSMNDTPQDTNGWASGDDDHVVARAEYDFTTDNNSELSFRAGQLINVAPKEMQPRVRGWLLASVDGKTGLIPANYVKILGKRRGRKHAALEYEQEQQRAAAGMAQERSVLQPLQQPSPLPQQPLAQSQSADDLSHDFSGQSDDRTAELTSLESENFVDNRAPHTADMDSKTDLENLKEFDDIAGFKE
ncbi:peroxisomal membrane protein PEX13-like [Ptychodera flava]|uniref:peroxisomal membrane protein PEX13-like n=1 Tax=Ptychodera flava TaxID=63121 RepID=UPI00396A2894